jgi:ribose transport system permease protein
MGTGFELGAIAVAVLGGTALAGGRGTAIGTAVGALIFGLVSNILALSGLGTYTNQVVRGCLLVVVVILINRVVRHQGVRSAS